MLSIAKKYNELFGFNILPLVNKAPAGDWSKWQDNPMSPEELSSLKWKGINGIGAVCGIGNLRCLDFDSVNDFSIVQQFLRKLGLPAEYKWTVASGSGKGYHIWFLCNDDGYLFKTLGGEKSYYRMEPGQSESYKPLPASPYDKGRSEEPLPANKPLRASKEPDKPKDNKPLPTSPYDKGRSLVDHIELRWRNCQTVLPPSLHPSGNKYKFHFLQEDHFPKMPPSNVPVEKLISCLTSYCKIGRIQSSVLGPQSSVHSQVREASDHPDINHTQLTHLSEFMEGRINNYDDWLRLGFALASLGEEGRQYFIKISRNNPEYNDSEEQLNKKFDGLIKDYRGDIKIGTFYEIARQYGYKDALQFFWKINNNSAKIFSSRLIEFLEEEGFYKMFISRGFIYIKDTANVIAEVTRVNIKDYVIDFIDRNTTGHNRLLIREYLIRCANALFGDSALECLRTVKPVFVTDEKNTAHFFYRNCFIEITKENMKVKEYSELYGKVWAKQIRERDFHFTQSKSEFAVLIENICRKDIGRINALRSAIGYLLVSYKDPTCAKAVIFTDEKLSEAAFGRSCKGLVAKSISHMKNVLHIDGKNFNFDKQFMFQSVDPDTQLLIYDDIKKKFPFEKLFSILTDGMTIEKKNMNEHYIPFEKAPKILITTNYAVEGTDDSSLDRQFVVEFSDYYNAKHKPSDDFKHLFFDEWNEEQWAAFDNFMADCCRYYLKHGLKPYEYVNLNKKKLIDSTSSEFEEFITSIPLNTEFNKKELFEQFKKEYEDYAKMRQGTFTNWTKMYAKLYNMEVKERRTGMERFIRISKVN